ncbi:MAG: hypothetical protein Fur0024_2580 [Patescibacteria group bacterium]
MISNFSRIRNKLSDEYGFLLFNFLIGLFFIFSGVYSKNNPEFMIPFNLFFYVLIFPIESIISRWISLIINNSTESKDRATTISTFVLLSKLPYAVLTIIGTQFAEMEKLTRLSMIFGVIIIFFTFFFKKFIYRLFEKWDS